jgi:hypothetical protein
MAPGACISDVWLKWSSRSVVKETILAANTRCPFPSFSSQVVLCSSASTLVFSSSILQFIQFFKFLPGASSEMRFSTVLLFAAGALAQTGGSTTACAAQV